MDQPSVESVCNLLAKSRLLTPDQVRGLLQTWCASARDAADVTAFTQWLVTSQYLTEYQIGLVLRGKVDHFFFGPYKILERIGKGRMAGVYKALHALGQLVAIKVLPPSKAKDAQTLTRFQREARIAMKLRHPNVVRTFHPGQTDGLYYIVMEYLDGETLEDVLRRRTKLPPPEAVRLAYQALLGMQHIHEQGMIHRDIKPGNFMLVGSAASTTERAVVKVMDIGLGKALFDEGAATGDNDLTTEGSLLGTPDYMAPEQARNVQLADIRSDIYSLGCTLYQMLAGQVPFPETNIIRQLMRHASETPRPLAQLNPAVPDGLQQIVDWMLAKDPAQRYPTPQRAAQALQMFLAAAVEPPPAPDSRMKVYLEWVDTQSGDFVLVEPVDKPAAPSETIVEAIPLARPIRQEVELEVVEAPAPKKRQPAPEPDEEPEPVPKKKRKSQAVAARQKKRTDDEDEETDERSVLNRRDWLMLALGGVVLGVAVLLVIGLVYGLHHLLRPKSEPEADDTSRSTSRNGSTGND